MEQLRRSAGPFLAILATAPKLHRSWVRSFQASEGRDHHDRQNILLSNGSQTTRLDKPLVEMINGNSK
jgi:hypothetical protein